MSIPFTIEAKLLLPPDVGLPPNLIAVSLASSFDSEADFVFKLVGTGAQSIDLGSIDTPGLKGLFIKVDAGASVQPIVVTVNGSSTGGVEISAGGWLAFASPNPATGITQLDIAFASDVTVRVWALG